MSSNSLLNDDTWSSIWSEILIVPKGVSEMSMQKASALKFLKL